MKQYQSIIFGAGAILALFGAAAYIIEPEVSRYVYTLGAVMVAVIQLINGYKGHNVTIKRLRKQQVFGAVLLLLTSLFMFTTQRNEWVVCLTIAAVIELYTAFRIPHLEEKEKK